MGFWNGIKKVFGTTGKVLRRVGEVGANFVKQNHQGLAMLANGVGDASNSPLLKSIGNAALAGSSLATTLGVGRNYFGPTGFASTGPP